LSVPAVRAIRVLDASVLVKWLVDEEGRDRALEVLDEVVQRPRGFAVPALIWYELTHVLLRVAPEPEAIQPNLEKLMHLGLPCFGATPERCARAVGLARRARLSGYDAHYVALAEELEGRWVTFDARAARAVSPRSRVQCLA
jgi:predicted nucleic acid-binding protein